MKMNRKALRDWAKRQRKSLTDALKQRGIEDPFEFAKLTGKIYVRVLGASSKELRIRYGLSRNENIRDALPSDDLVRVASYEQRLAAALNDDSVSVTEVMQQTATVVITF